MKSKIVATKKFRSEYIAGMNAEIIIQKLNSDDKASSYNVAVNVAEKQYCYAVTIFNYKSAKSTMWLELTEHMSSYYADQIVEVLSTQISKDKSFMQELQKHW